MRMWAAQENTQLSDQVCQLRHMVEAGRLKLKELRQQKTKLSKEMDKLLSDLRCTEEMERRTTNVAIETEITVSKLKEELI